MRILGFDITRTQVNKDYSPVMDGRGGWYPIVNEPFPGAWQRNISINQTLITAYSAVFACTSLIAGDVSKLWIKTQRLAGNVWLDLDESKTSPKTLVLDKPNGYQTRNQFFEHYMISKLLRGNVYVLLRRDARGVVTRMHVMDPNRVSVLVSDSGDVFYELGDDNLVGQQSKVTVPASEIIHDRMNCFFHPLVGLSPLYAAALPAQQGLNIQNNSTAFFGNRSMPGGIITAPTTIPDATAQRLKDNWEKNYGPGGKTGGTAVLGDGLEFKPITITAQDAQMLEQAKATAEWVCSAFHVPPWKIGAAEPPPQSNIEAMNLQYYSDCVQKLLEDCETCLDRGLDLGPKLGIEFDTSGLMRMDTMTQVTALKEAIGAGVLAPDEARARLGYGPVEGGDSPYLQQQNYSLAALAKRDAQDDPFGTAKPPAPAAAPAGPPKEGDDNASDTQQRAADQLTRCVKHVERCAA